MNSEKKKCLLQVISPKETSWKTRQNWERIKAVTFPVNVGERRLTASHSQNPGYSGASVEATPNNRGKHYPVISIAQSLTMWFKRNKRDDRNEKINEILERIGNKAALMSAKTERLRVLRDHYEAYLNRVYPIKKDYSTEMYSSRSRSYENIFFDEPSCLTYDLRPRSEDRYLSTLNRVLNRPYLEDTLSSSTSELDFRSLPYEQSRLKLGGVPEIHLSSEFLHPDESTLFRSVESININSPTSDRLDIRYSQDDLLKPILTTTTYPNNDFFDSPQKMMRGTSTSCDNCERLRRTPRQTQSFAIRSRSYDSQSPRVSEFNRLRSRSFSTKNSTSYLKSLYPHDTNHNTATKFSTSPRSNGMFQKIKSKINDLRLPFQKNTYIDDRIKYNLEKSKLILDRYSRSPHTWDIIKNSDLRDEYIDDYLKQVSSRRVPNYTGNFERQTLLNKSFRLDDNYSRRHSEFSYDNKVSSPADKSAGSYKKPDYKHVTFAPETNYLSSRSTPQSTRFSYSHKDDTIQNYNYFPSSSAALSWYRTNYTSDLPDMHANLNRSHPNLILPSEKYMNEFKKIPVYQRYLNSDLRDNFQKRPDTKSENGYGVVGSKILHMPKEETIEMNSQAPKISVQKALDEPLHEVSEQFYRLQTLDEKPVETTDPLEAVEGMQDESIKKSIITEDEESNSPGKTQVLKNLDSDTAQNKESAVNQALNSPLDSSTAPSKENIRVQSGNNEVSSEAEKNDNELLEPTLTKDNTVHFDETKKPITMKSETAMEGKGETDADSITKTEISQKQSTNKPKSQAAENDQEQEMKGLRNSFKESTAVEKTLKTEDAFNRTESQTVESVEESQKNKKSVKADKIRTEKSQPTDDKTAEEESVENLKEISVADKKENKIDNESQQSVLDKNPAQYEEVPQHTSKTEPKYYPEETQNNQNNTYYNEPEQQYKYDDQLKAGPDPTNPETYYEEPNEQPYEQTHNQFEGHTKQPYTEYPQSYADHVQQPYAEQPGEQYDAHSQQKYDDQSQQPYEKHSEQMYEEPSQLPYEEHLQQPYDEHRQQPYQDQIQQPYKGQTQQPYEDQTQPPYEDQTQQPYEDQTQPPYEDQTQPPYEDQTQQLYNDQTQQPYDDQTQQLYDEHSQQQYTKQQKPYEEHAYEQSHAPYESEVHYDKNAVKDADLYSEYETRPENIYSENQTYNQHKAPDEYEQYDGRQHGSQEYHAPEAANVQSTGKYPAYQKDYRSNNEDYGVGQQRDEYGPNDHLKEYGGHSGADFGERRIPKEYHNEYIPESQPVEEYREPVEDYRNTDPSGQYVHNNEDYGHDQYKQKEYLNDGGEYTDPNATYADPSYGMEAHYPDGQREYADHVQEQYSQEQYAPKIRDPNLEHHSQDTYDENYVSQQETAQYEDPKISKVQNEGYREPYYEPSNQ